MIVILSLLAHYVKIIPASCNEEIRLIGNKVFFVNLESNQLWIYCAENKAYLSLLKAVKLNASLTLHIDTMYIKVFSRIFSLNNSVGLALKLSYKSHKGNESAN